MRDFETMLKFILMTVVFALVFNPGVSQAKGGDDQDQIILLNDSAAALEDSNPGLSKSLTHFADEKEKEWEYKNAHKDTLLTPVTDKNIHQWQEQIKLLKATALAIQPNYPLIAKSLLKMAKDINRAIEIR
jgi:nitrate reductase alpha subunit